MNEIQCPRCGEWVEYDDNYEPLCGYHFALCRRCDEIFLVPVPPKKEGLRRINEIECPLCGASVKYDDSDIEILCDECGELVVLCNERGEIVAQDEEDSE